MKLIELEPQFLRVKEPNRVRHHVDSLGEAQGVMFLCPACFAKNNGPVGPT